MRIVKTLFWPALLMLTVACVTINIYFPAAEAEEAARAIVREILGKEDQAQPETKDPKQSIRIQQSAAQFAHAVVDALIPSAHAAQANINVNTPAIQSIRRSMAKRQQAMRGFYQSGAIGFSDNGFVAVRSLKGVALGDRNKLKKLVASDNKDRKALYREIAKANGHPEWEQQVQSTFAKVWIQEAGRGYWYKSGGSWKQK